jgi:hypothetical protein
VHGCSFPGVSGPGVAGHRARRNVELRACLCVGKQDLPMEHGGVERQSLQEPGIRSADLRTIFS